MRLNPFADKCLCGSGRILLECCLKDCRPPRNRARTGRSNRRCYAAPLCDCSPTISREHYITEGVLKLIGDPITIKGFPWQGEEMTLPTKNLTSKILCQRHNPALSELDKVGIRFFEKLRAARVENPLSHTVASSHIYLFRGEMVELWMLKVLYGLIVSKNALDRTGTLINAALPRNWLGVLFEHEPMPGGWGLYMPGSVSHAFGSTHPNGALVIYENATLFGFILTLDYLSFILAMNNPPRERAGTLLENCTYRPDEIEINSRHRQDTLRLFWERPGDERRITNS